jgi:translocation and assembly module TamA
MIRPPKRPALNDLSPAPARALGPIAVMLCLFANMALATEAILTAPGADKGLTDMLRSSSRAIAAIEAKPPETRKRRWRLFGQNETPDAQEPFVPATPEDIVALAGNDYARLLATLYGQGYFAPVISIQADGREVADLSPFDPVTRLDRLVITVQTGPAFSFGSVRIAPLAPGDVLPETVAPGEPARIAAMESGVREALTGWREQAYAKPQVVDQTVVADNSAATLSAGFTIDPGRTATFGTIGVQGTERVRPDRVRQIAGIQSGKPFNPDRIDDATRRLRKAGAFSAVSVTEADTIDADGAVDLTFNVAEAKPRRIGAGAEYSTSEGLTLTAFWLHRNLRNAAERLRFDAEIDGLGGTRSGINYRIATLYTRPATFTPDTDAVVGFGAESLDEDFYQSDGAHLTFGIDRYIDEKMDASLYFRYDYSDVNDAFGRRHFNILAFQGRFRYDDRDNKTEPTKGIYAEARLQPFYNADVSVFGARMLFDGRTYRQLGRRLVLAGRVQLGSITGATLEEVPPQYLFYSGGTGTVRGQSYQNLGVVLPNGNTTGGRGFGGYSVEARFSVTDAIGAVAFYDAGYISPESTPFVDGNWQSGAGLGVRYKTPIGPLRVDLGTPVHNGKSGDLELYIGIGEAF